MEVRSSGMPMQPAASGVTAANKNESLSSWRRLRGRSLRSTTSGRSLESKIRRIHRRAAMRLSTRAAAPTSSWLQLPFFRASAPSSGRLAATPSAFALLVARSGTFRDSSALSLGSLLSRTPVSWSLDSLARDLYLRTSGPRHVACTLPIL